MCWINTALTNVTDKDVKCQATYEKSPPTNGRSYRSLKKRDKTSRKVVSVAELTDRVGRCRVCGALCDIAIDWWQTGKVRTL